MLGDEGRARLAAPVPLEQKVHGPRRQDAEATEAEAPVQPPEDLPVGLGESELLAAPRQLLDPGLLQRRQGLRIEQLREIQVGPQALVPAARAAAGDDDHPLLVDLEPPPRPAQERDPVEQLQVRIAGPWPEHHRPIALRRPHQRSLRRELGAQPRMVQLGDETRFQDRARGGREPGGEARELREDAAGVDGLHLRPQAAGGGPSDARGRGRLLFRRPGQGVPDPRAPEGRGPDQGRSAGTTDGGGPLRLGRDAFEGCGQRSAGDAEPLRGEAIVTGGRGRRQGAGQQHEVQVQLAQIGHDPGVGRKGGGHALENLPAEP